MIDTHTAGDPMRDGVVWTNLTRSEIAAALGQEGFEVSTTTVDHLLDQFGFRYRKAQRIKTMGDSADRNAQFEKIGRLKRRYLKAGLPVLSIDGKKREILGDYVRPGGCSRRPRCAVGIMISLGIDRALSFRTAFTTWDGTKDTCI